MKNLVLIFSVALMASSGFAQKFAYVDTEYILMHLQEYADAQAELNSYSAQWQEEIEEKYASIALLTESFQAEKALLTLDMQKRREEELKQKRTQARDLQKRRFGVDGDLFKKREELMKPVQEMMYEAILEVSSQSGYMVIFDKSNQSNMLYANPKHDVSDKVLKKMGKTPGETIELPAKGEGNTGSTPKGDSSAKGKSTSNRSGTPQRGGKTGGK
ncbi:MAG: OmpH family outer membrane protein [Flavobacteriales bacterium]